MFTLFQTSDCSSRIADDNTFYMAIEQFHCNQMHFVIDPVHFTLMEGFDNTIFTLVLTFVIVFNQLHQIAFLEITTYPVFLTHVA